MKLRNLLRADKRAQMGMIGAAIGLFITIKIQSLISAVLVRIIAVLIYYNIVGSIDVTGVDAKLPGTPALNATTQVNNQAATFFTIAPKLTSLKTGQRRIVGIVKSLNGFSARSDCRSGCHRVREKHRRVKHGSCAIVCA